MTEEQVQARKTLSRFAYGLGILGGVLAVFGIYFLFISNESLSWSSVEGIVVSTEINNHVTNRPNPASAAPSTFVEYYISVSYKYEVEGESYFSSSYSLGEGDRASRFYSERSLAEEAATELFPAGSSLTVYYDPKMPSSALLAPGWNWGTFVPLLLGIFFGGAGWFVYSLIKEPNVPQ